MKFKLFFIVLLLTTIHILQAQNVGIGTNTPDASAKLDITSTDKGILIPEVDIAVLSTPAPVSSPKTSLLVYNKNTTTGPGYFYWDGAKWVKILNSDDSLNDADSDPHNEDQTVVAGTGITVSVSGQDYTVTNAAPDQTIVLTGAGGTTITGTYPNFTITSTDNIDDADHVIGNEYNTGLSLSGTILTVTDGGGNKTQDLSSLKDHDWYKVGTTTAPTNINDNIFTEGKVGIGNTSPNSRLNVGKNTSTIDEGVTISSKKDAFIKILADRDNATETDNPYIYMSQDNSSSVASIIGHTPNNGKDPQNNNYTGALNNGMLLGTLGNIPLQLGTNDNARLTIESGGDVGIGTTNPQFKLDVTGEVRAKNGNGFRISQGGESVIHRYDGTNYYLLFSSTETGGWNTNRPFRMEYSTGNVFLTTNTSSNVAIGNGTPNDKLDVFGNAQVSGYLKVGNPTAPSAHSSTSKIRLYYTSFDNTADSWVQSNGCSGDLGWSNPSGKEQWEQGNNNDDDYLYSPFIYIPPVMGTSNLTAEWDMDVCTEVNWDGLRVEISINGGTWSFVASSKFNSGGYNSIADDNCGGGPKRDAWSHDNHGNFKPVLDLDDAGVKPGDWVRLRFEASTDGSSEECFTDIELFEFGIYGRMESVTAGFNNGSIYAEGNVFANSTQLLGDVAEYFPVKGYSKPGDIIAFDNSSNIKDTYKVSDIEENSFIVGIHSTNPSLLLNSPNAGIPVAMAGRVPVNIVGDIKAGDFITSSNIKGFAKKATKNCFVIGKALESFNGEKGQILCLVQPGWFNPYSSNGNIITGSFVAEKGKKKIIIFDSSLSEKSKIFFTMLNSYTSTYWITDKKEGQFTINFETALNHNLNFDYLVFRTNTSANIPEKKSLEVKKNNAQTQKIKPENNNIENDYIIKEKELNSFISLEELDAIKPPSIPIDETSENVIKTYIYTYDRKLIEKIINISK